MKSVNASVGCIVRSQKTGVLGATLLVVSVSCLAPAAGVAMAQQPAGAQTPAATSSPLPGGATSVQEAHDDWTVLCGQKDGQKVCALSQQLLDKDSRQRVLVLELDTAASDRASGNLLLPFGLAVDREVTLQLDGSGMGTPLHFRTCVPNGCLVTLAFDAKIISELRKGTTLAIQAIAADGGKPVTFSVSLKGFSSGLDRTASLQK